MLQSIKGADTAQRVGTDALTPTFAKLLPMAFPNAELVDAEPAMQRGPPDQDSRGDRRLSREALRVAERGLAAAVAELRPGITEQALAGARAGGEGRRRGEHPGHPGRRLDHVEGAPVAPRPPATGRCATAIWWRCRRACSPTAMSARWPAPGRSARSPTPMRAAVRRSRWAVGRAVAACRPGAGHSDLLAAYEAAGEPLRRCRWRTVWDWVSTRRWSRRNLRATAHAELLEAGMVLAVTAYVWESRRRCGVHPRRRADHRRRRRGADV